MGSELGAKAKEELISFFLFWCVVGVQVSSSRVVYWLIFGVFVAVVAVVRFFGLRGKGFDQFILLTSARFFSLERDASSSGIVLVSAEARST